MKNYRKDNNGGDNGNKNNVWSKNDWIFLIVVVIFLLISIVAVLNLASWKVIMWSLPLQMVSAVLMIFLYWKYLREMPFTEVATRAEPVPRLNQRGEFASKIVIPAVSITGLWIAFVVAIMHFGGQMKASTEQIEKTTVRVHEQMVLSSEQSMQAVKDTSNKFELAMRQFEGQMNTTSERFEEQRELIAHH